MSVAIGSAACGSDESTLPNLLVGGAADAATPFISAFGAQPDASLASGQGLDGGLMGPPFTNEAGVVFQDAGVLDDFSSNPFVSDSGSSPFVSDSGSNPFVSDSGASPTLGLPFGQ
jgi:hypothetical protein